MQVLDVADRQCGQMLCCLTAIQWIVLLDDNKLSVVREEYRKIFRYWIYVFLKRKQLCRVPIVKHVYNMENWKAQRYLSNKKSKPCSLQLINVLYQWRCEIPGVEDMSLDSNKWHELGFGWKAGWKLSSFGWKFQAQLNKWGHLFMFCLTVQSGQDLLSFCLDEL